MTATRPCVVGATLGRGAHAAPTVGQLPVPKRCRESVTLGYIGGKARIAPQLAAMPTTGAFSVFPNMLPK